MSVYLYDRLPLNQGIVLDHPNFEGTGTIVRDISKYHNNGVFGAGAAAPIWVQLASGEWVQLFDGIQTYENCGNASSINPAIAITIEVWENSLSFVDNACIIRRVSAYFIRQIIDSTLQFACYVGGAKLLKTIFIYSLNTWYHLCATYDGANMRFYTNGTEDINSPKVQVGALDADVNNLYLGSRESASSFISGLLGRRRIYNRALSNDEIAARFQETRGFYGV